MRIGYITNASTHSGVGYRAAQIREILAEQSDINITDIAFPQSLPFHSWPGALGSKSINWIRWGRRINSNDQDLFHITNQTLSFLAKKLTPSIVTVHDIIEAVEPQAKAAAMINRYLYSGITKAAHIVAVSSYTKEMIMNHYSIPTNRITVIPNAVDGAFFPIEDVKSTIGYQELRKTYRLGDNHPIVLYVGSDHPRKNLPVALRAFANIRAQRPDALFLKVGAPGILAEREKNLEIMDTLHIRDSVRMIDTVSNEDLNTIYNLADVLVFPSQFEGFGLPPLQAMATGLPVVTSNTTSLPEVVGDAALTCDPQDVDAFTDNMLRITQDRTVAAEYRNRGIARARSFSWEKSVGQLIDVYKKVV